MSTVDITNNSKLEEAVKYGATYMEQLARGLHTGKRPATVEGKNEGVNSDDWEDVWEGSTDLIPMPALTGELVTFKSDDSQDNPTGNGAREVVLEYLDYNGHLKEAVKPTNGTGEIIFDDLVYGIIDFYVSDGGTGLVASGDINLYRNGTPSRVYVNIKAGGNKSLSSLRTIPSNVKYMITGIIISGDTNGTEVAIRSTSTDRGGITDEFQYRTLVDVKDSAISICLDPPMVILPRSSIKASARKIGQGQGKVAVTINGYLEEVD